MAIKKLTDDNKARSDEEESRLRDTNGYMYITFLQTILAFLMQDAPEALTQVLLRDETSVSRFMFRNNGLKKCHHFRI